MIALRSSVASLGVIAVLALAPTTFAETLYYSAELKASSEVPANDGKGTGKLYFNVHTAAHPGREIRGQVTKAP